MHLARVLELLRASGPQDALREGRSPSILEALTHTQIPGKHTPCAFRQIVTRAPKMDSNSVESFFFFLPPNVEASLQNGKSLKRSLSHTKTESTSQDGAPPDYLLPGSSERPLMALLPHSSQPEVHK